MSSNKQGAFSWGGSANRGASEARLAALRPSRNPPISLAMLSIVVICIVLF